VFTNEPLFFSIATLEAAAGISLDSENAAFKHAVESRAAMYESTDTSEEVLERWQFPLRYTGMVFSMTIEYTNRPTATYKFLPERTLTAMVQVRAMEKPVNQLAFTTTELSYDDKKRLYEKPAGDLIKNESVWSVEREAKYTSIMGISIERSVTSDVVENDLAQALSSIFGSLLVFAVAQYILELIGRYCSREHHLRYLLKFERAHDETHSQLRRIEKLEKTTGIMHHDAGFFKLSAQAQATVEGVTAPRQGPAGPEVVAVVAATSSRQQVSSPYQVQQQQKEAVFEQL
jgi:hypothetical protein